MNLILWRIFVDFTLSNNKKRITMSFTTTSSLSGNYSMTTAANADELFVKHSIPELRTYEKKTRY